MRYGMVIDLNRCMGCHACSIACKIENATPPGVFWNRVFQVEEGKYPNVRRSYIPRPCMQCDTPACLEVCSTKATYKDRYGLVQIDYTKCIGCKACILACPYGARSLNEGGDYFSNGTPWGETDKNHQKGTVEKCTFCSHLIKKGLEPACVSTCPARARYFGDLDDPQSDVSQLIKGRFGFQFHPEFNLDPSVYYIPPKGVTLGIVYYTLEYKQREE
jgi:Fe-S-cluster-containing dehydrogenase component